MRKLLLITLLIAANAYSDTRSSMEYEIKGGNLSFFDTGDTMALSLSRGDSFVSVCDKIKKRFNEGGQACDIVYLESKVGEACTSSSRTMGQSKIQVKVNIAKGRPWYFLSDLEQADQGDVSPEMAEKMKRQIRSLRSQNRDYSYRYSLDVNCL